MKVAIDLLSVLKKGIQETFLIHSAVCSKIWGPPGLSIAVVQNITLCRKVRKRRENITLSIMAQ